jgi:hypothetical protein
LSGAELVDCLGGIEDALHHDGRIDDQIGPLVILANLKSVGGIDANYLGNLLRRRTCGTAAMRRQNAETRRVYEPPVRLQSIGESAQNGMPAVVPRSAGQTGGDWIEIAEFGRRWVDQTRRRLAALGVIPKDHFGHKRIDFVFGGRQTEGAHLVAHTAGALLQGTDIGAVGIAD